MTSAKKGGSQKLPNTTSSGGYGKPPKDKQFKKGKSGNPSGRPKKDKMFKSVSRVLRESLLEEVEGSVNGKPRKMLRLEAVLAKQVSNALQGNVQAAKFVLSLAEKHIPTHRSLEELMEGRSVFEWTKEEMARFSKASMMKHLNQDLHQTPEDDANQEEDKKRSGDGEAI
jgi:hypothetical protein